MAPIVHVVTQGHMANRMIQHLVATRIASLAPEARISNVDLPEWGIHYPALDAAGEAEAEVHGQFVDVEGWAARLRAGEVQRLLLPAYGQWLANFPDRATCQRMFPADPAVAGYGADTLVCNIRGGEVLDARHPDYTLLPIRFYAECADRFGLRLVFTGQIEDNLYCNDLARAFPDASFRPSEGAWTDFQVFRNSANLLPAVSTFSWLAAWLSDAARIIQPVSGLFHPVQCPEINLLPLADARYLFVLFPINYAVPVAGYRAAHAAMQGLWRLMRPEAIGALRHGPRWPGRVETALPWLDQAFYLETYPDVAAAVASGHLTAFGHYRDHGYREGRRGFALDRRWYSTAYPIAALEVGGGDYASLEHHWLEIGRERGYRRLPPDTTGDVR